MARKLFHFNGVPVGLDEFTLNFDLKKEQDGGPVLRARDDAGASEKRTQEQRRRR